MSPEEKELLEKTYELSKENNEILRSLRRRARFSTAWRIAYWVLIIGISLGAFYFIQPYVEMVRDLTNGNVSEATQDSYVDQIRSLIE